MAKLVAITGGIGAGKSYVSRIIENLGYKVYDCDSRAKLLMNSDKHLQSSLIDSFGSNVIDSDGCINNKYLASVVFADRSLLNKLNSIVHPAVREDILKWSEDNRENKFLFIETAILKESGLDRIVDAIIYVEADEELRINRVMARNSIDRHAVEQRIKHQNIKVEDGDYIIVNDGKLSLVSQIESVIKQLEAS